MSQQLLDYVKAKLDPQLSIPLYLQLKRAMHRAIDEKILLHGSILPSERKTSQSLALSRVTVVKALHELLEIGLVIKRQGKGTVVNLPVNYNLASGGFSSQFQHIGIVSNRWLVRERISADTILAGELEVDTGTLVSKIKRVVWWTVCQCLWRRCISLNAFYHVRICWKDRFMPGGQSRAYTLMNKTIHLLYIFQQKRRGSYLIWMKAFH